MKLIPLTIFSLLGAMTAYAAPVAESTVGIYALEVGKPGNSLEIVLECTKETNCTLTSQLKSDKDSFKEVQVLNNVRPVENLTDASNALKYAIDHQTQSPKSPDAMESMQRLRPVLSSNPRISRCWDLNYSSPEYMLACTFSNAPVDSPPVFLFATLMSNCNDVFCRYIITPMSRAK